MTYLTNSVMDFWLDCQIFVLDVKIAYYNAMLSK